MCHAELQHAQWAVQGGQQQQQQQQVQGNNQQRAQAVTTALAQHECPIVLQHEHHKQHQLQRQRVSIRDSN